MSRPTVWFNRMWTVVRHTTGEPIPVHPFSRSVPVLWATRRLAENWAAGFRWDNPRIRCVVVPVDVQITRRLKGGGK